MGNVSAVTALAVLSLLALGSPLANGARIPVLSRLVEADGRQQAPPRPGHEQHSAPPRAHALAAAQAPRSLDTRQRRQPGGAAQQLDEKERNLAPPQRQAQRRRGLRAAARVDGFDAAHQQQRAARENAQQLKQRNSAFIGFEERASRPDHNIVITTAFGAITIQPRADISPITVAMVESLAAHPDVDEGAIIRHEPVPDDWGKDGFFGPPYGLLGGHFESPDQDPPQEGRPLLRRGDVAMIPGSMDWFVALTDHTEWGHAHTVWGLVSPVDKDSWATIRRIPTEPFVTAAHGKVSTRWLAANATVPFKVSLRPAGVQQLMSAATTVA
ncbi:MAG: hypothetical protein J3K34DRAFT_436041 [Monoraphidium minutum]|nr:MAG: hypothetical protein J3K34DRAFT_436041 [Monoraphidium minutum]